MPSSNGRLVGVALVLGSLLSTSIAQAQGVSESALAEGLFRTGRALVAQGKYAQACPKFAESQRIDPKLGTLMNLALCHEKEGRTASAWAEYVQAAELASRAGQADREKVARTSAAALEPTLPRIVLRQDGSDPVTVLLDDHVIGAAVLGTAFPIDPGAHELIVNAPGHKTFSQQITIVAAPGEKMVTIPKLDLAGPVVVPVPSAVVQGPADASNHAGPYGHRVLGYALVGGGAAVVVAGGIAGIVAFKEKSAAGPQCSATQCTQEGLNDISSMKAAEAFSTVAFAAGIVSTGAGVYFILTSGTRTEPSPLPQASLHLAPVVGPGVGGLSFAGTF
jgi:hypothetical protein